MDVIFTLPEFGMEKLKRVLSPGTTSLTVIVTEITNHY